MQLYLVITKLELHEDCSGIAETAAVKITFTKAAHPESWYQTHTVVYELLLIVPTID